MITSTRRNTRSTSRANTLEQAVGPVATSEYSLDTTKLYKIWFSNNPKVFMNAQNILRTIRMRLDNPQAKISLIFSSKCLTVSATKELKVFCKNLNISPIDFDKDIPALLQRDKDKQVYHIAKMELEHFLSKQGGNLAAASDALRVIFPVIENFGIYSDYDVNVDFSKASSIIKTKTSFIINSGKFSLGLLLPNTPFFNSDFIAATFDPQNPKQLSKEAKEKLELVQDCLIENYSNLTADRFLKDLVGDSQFSLIPAVKNYIKRFFESHHNPTIFEFRSYCAKFSAQGIYNPISHMLSNELINHLLMIETVSKQSGPGILLGLVKEYVNIPFTPSMDGFVLCVEPQEKWEAFCNQASQMGINSNHLSDYVTGHQDPNVVAREIDHLVTLKDIGSFCDQSWTEVGAKRQEDLSQKINEAANKIQSCYRRYKQRENEGLQAIKKRMLSKSDVFKLQKSAKNEMASLENGKRKHR